MSEQNVALARQTYEAFNRGDLDAVLGMFDPEIEVHDPPEMPDSAVHRGLEAVMRDWQRTFDSFDEFSIELEECHDLGDELLVLLRYRGRGRGSGVDVEAAIAHLLTLRDGKLVRMRQFLDRAAALEAAGLPPARPGTTPRSGSAAADR
jgi:ketosteroid isomerase-like protein